MDNLERMKLRTNEPDDAILVDCLESAKAIIMTHRFPYQEWPDELENRYFDLQFRMALAIYNKDGGDFETSHSENGVTRVFGSEGVPQELINEIVPYGAVVS